MREKGIRQKEIVEKTGYTQEYVSRVLNGKQPLTRDFYHKVMKFLMGNPAETLKEEKEEYERQVAELEARVDRLEKDLEQADLENEETRRKLDEAYETTQKLLKKYNITE